MMARSAVRHERPATAEDLLALHPNVTVCRDLLGAIAIDPARGARPPFDGFSTALHPIFFRDRTPNAALYVTGTAPRDSMGTTLSIPIYDEQANIRVEHIGRIDPPEVVVMATEGICLLDDLGDLADGEQLALMAMLGGVQKAHDEMRFQDRGASLEAMLSRQPSQATLMVARQALLAA